MQLFKSIRVWVTKKDINTNKIYLTLSKASSDKALKANARYLVATYPL